jgi:hypothetical protein
MKDYYSEYVNYIYKKERPFIYYLKFRYLIKFLIHTI